MRRYYQGNETPEAKRLRREAQGHGAEDAFRRRMIEQFGSPDGPKNGGRRPGAGAKKGTGKEIDVPWAPGPPVKVNESLIVSAEDWQILGYVLASDPITKIACPNLAALIEIELERKYISVLMEAIVSTPSFRVMWRSNCERYARVFNINYERTVKLYREAKARIEAAHGDVAHQFREKAHHLLEKVSEIMRLNGDIESVREFRETLKMVIQAHGTPIAAKMGGGPAPGQSREEWLREMLERLEGAVGQVRADLESEQDARALPASVSHPLTDPGVARGASDESRAKQKSDPAQESASQEPEDPKDDPSGG